MELHNKLGAFGSRRSSGSASPRAADVVGLAAATAAGLTASTLVGSWFVPDPVLVLAHVAFFFTALLAAEHVEQALQSRVHWSSSARSTLALGIGCALTAAFLVTLLAVTGSGLAAASMLGRVIFDVHSLAISLALVVPAVVLSRRLIARPRLHQKAIDKTVEQDSERLSLIFHELRRPLTMLVSASELAMEPDISESERLQLVETIHRRSLDLSGFLEEFIEVARVQNGSVNINVRPSDIPRLVSEVIAEFSGPRQSHHIEVMGEGPLVAPVDDGKLRIILKNLLSNAIAYSPNGSLVTVRFHRGKASLVLEVEDQGPGVPRAYREQVFQQFFRVPGTTARGFGLGLYLVRQLVLAHGGTVSLTDAEPTGARFTVVLPAAEARVAPTPRGSSSSGSVPSAGRQRPTVPARREPLSRRGRAELPEGPAMP
jgi:signal transduction histidine kinase